jgi:hypothetical protein
MGSFFGSLLCSLPIAVVMRQMTMPQIAEVVWQKTTAPIAKVAQQKTTNFRTQMAAENAKGLTREKITVNIWSVRWHKQHLFQTIVFCS